MLNDTELQDLARQRTRAELASSSQFQALPFEDQKGVYQKTYAQHLSRLAAEPGGTTATALADRASRLIDDSRHENKRIEQAPEMMGDFVREVNFPQFVKDLVGGVFEANLTVQAQQTARFIELMKAATQSVAKFIQEIDPAASFAYLAENNSDEFSLGFDDDDKDDQGNPKPILTDKEGNKLDVDGDEAIKAKIMDAKIAMAKEQRALLREVMLMGVQRMVIEKGNIKASVLFDFKASEDIIKKDQAATKKTTSAGGSMSFSGGLIGSIIGGPRHGGGMSTRNTQMTVASTKSTASTSLAAKLAGSVDLTFKTDYFKLDNFAQMYGPVTGDERAAAGAAKAPAVPAAR